MTATQKEPGEQRVVLVTGGSSGIGSACVTHFAAKGWRTVVNYLGADQQLAAEELAEATGGIAVQGDVSRDEDCRRMAQHTLDRFGRLDALVCSAGTTRPVPHADLEALKVEDFHLTASVHTVGAFLITRACAPALAKGDGGAVVIVSSYGAIFGGGSSIAYAASKGAVNTLTMSLARVLAPKIRVNAVCPALVADGFVQRMDPARFEARAEQQRKKAPLAKVGRPEEVAADVYWLAAGASLVTGSAIMLDCGLHLNGDA